MKSLRGAMALIVALIASRCTTLSPEAERVHVARNGGDVAGCKMLGAVRGVAGANNMPDDDIRSLQNEAAALNADTLLVTHRAYFNSAPTGVAYVCSGARTARSAESVPASGALLVRILPDQHRAEVNGVMWRNLDPATRQREARAFADQCPHESDRAPWVAIYDAATGEQIGQLGGSSPHP